MNSDAAETSILPVDCCSKSLRSVSGALTIQKQIESVRSSRGELIDGFNRIYSATYALYIHHPDHDHSLRDQLGGASVIANRI